MAFEVDFSITIATAPETVWKLLIDTSTWTVWWRDCLAARTENLRALREGSKLELVLQPRQLKHTFRPEVDLITEERTLSLTDRGVFFRATVAWYLQPHDLGTRINLKGNFAGVATLLMRLTRADDSARFTLHASLRGLKRLAEQVG